MYQTLQHCSEADQTYHFAEELKELVTEGRKRILGVLCVVVTAV